MLDLKTYNPLAYVPDAEAVAFWQRFKSDCAGAKVDVLTKSEADASGLTWDKLHKNNTKANPKKLMVIVPDCAMLMLDIERFPKSDVGTGKVCATMCKSSATVCGNTFYSFRETLDGGSGIWVVDDKMQSFSVALNPLHEDINRTLENNTEKNRKMKKAKDSSAAELLSVKQNNIIASIFEVLYSHSGRIGNGSKTAILNAAREYITTMPDKVALHQLNGCINLLNGCYNINTKVFESGPHPEHGFTTICNTIYDPSANSAMVRRFLSDFTRKNGHRRPHVEQYLVDVLGSMLSSVNGAIIKSHLVMHGASTNNCKSTLMDLLANTLGKTADGGLYAALDPKEMDSFSNNSNTLTSGLCACEGAMLIQISEPKKSLVMDCGLLKQMTSGNPISLNPKYEKNREHTFRCLPVVDCNSFPCYTDASIFTSGRLKILDCCWQPPNPDPEYSRKLSEPIENRATMFNILLEGYYRYHSRGDKFDTPKELQDLLTYYSSNNNPIRRFIASELKVTGAKCDSVKIAELLQPFDDYMSSVGETKRPDHVRDKLEDELNQTKGCIVKLGSGNVKTVYGIRLKNAADRAADAEKERNESAKAEITSSEILDRFFYNYCIHDVSSVTPISAVDIALSNYLTTYYEGVRSEKIWSDIYGESFYDRYGDEDCLLEYFSRHETDLPYTYDGYGITSLDVATPFGKSYSCMALDGLRLATQEEIAEKEKQRKYQAVESEIKAEMQSGIRPEIYKALMDDETVVAKLAEIIAVYADSITIA